MSRSWSDRKVWEWRRRLERFVKSRLSISKFCECEGVSQASFYLWRKRLAGASGVPPAPDTRAPFRPVRLLPAAGISVQLPGGTQLTVPVSDAESLRLVIEALADADRRGGVGPC